MCRDEKKKKRENQQRKKKYLIVTRVHVPEPITDKHKKVRFIKVSKYNGLYERIIMV